VRYNVRTMATNSEPDDRILLTVRDVGRRLQVHEVTVRRHILAGRLKALRVGKSVRVTPKDLEEYLHPRGAEGGPRARPQRVAEPGATYRRQRGRTAQSAAVEDTSTSDPASDESEALAAFEWPEPNYALLAANFARIDAARAAQPKTRRRRTPRPLTMDDGIWNLIGMISDPELADLSENKHKYLADVYGEDNK
jgi:excisionase family DNA binding protein